MKITKRANPDSSHQKEINFFSIFKIWYLYELTDVHKTCGNHFVMYMLHHYAAHLTLISAECQLYLNKTGRKKEIQVKLLNRHRNL